MKTTSCLSLIVLLSVTGALFAADPTAATDTRVTVVFDHPEKYRDLQDSGLDPDNERGRKQYLPQIKEYIEKEAGRLLAPGRKLTITFTDIDLAGDYEPWHGPQFHDVRIVKSIYPPRLSFSFKVTDESGLVLNEGERKLIDLSFQMRITRGFNDDLLRYEKEMISDWLREELRTRRS